MTTALDATVTSVVDRLRADVAALQSLDISEVDGATGPELHRALGTLAGQVQAVAARVLARVEDDGRWQAAGSRTFGEWVARRQGTSVGAARRDAALGHALDDALPQTSAAVAAGTVSLEHAQLLARHGATSPARRAALASPDPRLNEAALVRQASRLGADDFRKTVQRWAQQVDEAAAEREHDAACAKEFFTVSRRPDGLALQGFLTHEHGEVLITALRAVAGVPPKSDTRAVDERQAAALVDAARLVLDRGLAGLGQQVRPHLSVHVSFESLQRQLRAAAAADGEDTPWLPEEWTAWVHGGAAPAELDDGSPIPPSLLARLACDSEISRVVFGPGSEVLDLGRSARTYTGQQRRAVIARDRSCRYPGCGAPPNLGEVHHVRWWDRDDGPTSVGNGILVCWYHHDLIHRRGLRIVRRAGAWQFFRADGTPIVDGRARDPGGGAQVVGRESRPAPEAAERAVQELLAIPAA